MSDICSPEQRTLLEQARRERGWSRERLAAEAQISAQTVYRIERGRVKAAPATRMVLAAALNLLPEELFGDA